MDNRQSLGKWICRSVYVVLALVMFGVLLLAAGFPLVALAAGPIEVTGNSDDGSPGTLRWAITQANNDPGPDTITFTPAVSGTIVLTATLPAITHTLDIRGPGAGVLAVSGDNAYRVFKVGLGTPVTVTALTVRDGQADNGGGIYTAGALVLSDTVVFSNTADYGGGVYVLEGSATLAGGQIISNTATSAGGGVLVDEATATVDMSGGKIISNTADYGGGVFVDEGSATLSGGELSGNTASDHGGGVYVDEGSATLDGGQVISNTADSRGGGVFVREPGATLDLSGGEIGGNTALYGGGVFVELGSATLSGGEIRDNTAIDAGGVYVDRGGAALSGVVVSGNTASGNGGGVYVWEGTAALTGGEIISNTGASGGGVYVSEEGGRLDTIGGRIAGNTASLGGAAASSPGPAADGSGTEDVHFSASFGGGGGVFVDRGAADLDGTHIMNNTASLGGGVYAVHGTTTLRGAEMSGNSATGAAPYGSGGGVYVERGAVTLTSMKVLRNTASTTGGALYQLTSAASVHVSDSCIVGNTATSVYNGPASIPTMLTATGNWWGAADGPSGAGPGHGDSVSDWVDYDPFLTEPIEGCPTLRHLYLPIVLKACGP